MLTGVEFALCGVPGRYAKGELARVCGLQGYVVLEYIYALGLQAVEMQG